MDIGYRMGREEDLEAILSFLQTRNTFPGYIGYEEPERVRKVIEKSYKSSIDIFSHPDQFPLLIAQDLNTKEILGYMLLIMGVEESITEEMQTQIYDYHIKNIEDAPQEKGLAIKKEIMGHFISQAEMLTMEKEYKYIITEIPVSTPEEEIFFSSWGFYIEMNRIVKEVKHHTFHTPRQKRYRVRFAQENDRIFLLLLNAQNSPFLIPSGRQADEDYIREAYFDIYSRMNITSNPTMKVFILDDIEEQRPTGFIMIKTEVFDMVSEKPLAYIYDLNVHKDYWGKYATQRLVKEAENYLMTQNVHYLIGDTSQSNPRPLKTAIRTLNFNLFSRKWVKAI